MKPHTAERLGWAAVAAMAVSALSPLVRVPWRSFTIVQAMLPWSLTPAVPLAAVAASTRRRGLAAASLAVTAAGVAMCVPLVRRRSPRSSTTPSLQIAFANLLYGNRHIAEAAPALLGRPGLDVAAFSEYTPAHAETLHHSELAALFPYRIEKPKPLGSGTALWSRYPIIERSGPDTAHQLVTADVHGPELVRVTVIHTQSPIAHHLEWRDDLAWLGTIANGGPPSVIIGDFNAAWWHPEFRRLLANGWRDAHHEVGRGLSASWPVGGPRVPFVRLDHALVDDALAVLDVADIAIAGSDHRGLVVSLAPAR
jgi:endonuclease/exonuclease/phosphatase (EEP) superfamily protein YafD